MSLFQTLAGLHGSALAYLVIGALTFVETLALVGFALPGTTLFIFAGVLCSRGYMRLEYVIAIIAVAGTAGSTLSYFFGKVGGDWIKEKNILHQEKLLRAERFFKRYGEWSVLISHFVGPLRPLIPMVAGIFKTPKKQFLIVNSLSALGSAVFFISLGFIFGRRWFVLARIISRYEVPALLSFFGIIALVLIFRNKYQDNKS
jgi:undecaprenyl-diphosphatase